MKLKLFIILLSISLLQNCTKPDNEYDLVIYGGTAAGIMAGVQAKRLGKSVIVINSSSHIGGLTTGGLSASDLGIKKTVGGLAKEFYEEVYKYYLTDSVWKTESKESISKYSGNFTMMSRFEPHVAQKVLDGFIEKYKIEVVKNEKLDLDQGVFKSGQSIISIKTLSGKEYKGKFFMDATYEGDLMALAGVSYHVGRESSDTYNESLGGVLPYYDSAIFQPKKFFGKGISPYDSEGKLLFGIQDVPLGEVGAGDKKIQAYNFRLCLTNDPNNMVPITRPENYDSMRFELLGRYVLANPSITLKRVGRLPAFYMMPTLPNSKVDINDGGVFSTDYIGGNWDYPEGDYETRESIWQDHVDYTKGLLYFTGHDPRVPENVRNEMLTYGYAKDEFVENDNFPPQLYIREARRMIGEYVMKQSDCVEDSVKNESVGIGSYAPDSHHLQRVLTEDGEIINEGNIYERHKPYEIPLGVLLPKEKECTNLLVPVCVSSSHISFGSIRMEPVFMILSQSAAMVASLAIDKNISVQDVEYKDVEALLIEANQKTKLDNL